MSKHQAPKRLPRKKNQDMRDFMKRYNVTLAEVWRFRGCKRDQIGAALANQLAAEHHISYGHISNILWVVRCLRTNARVARYNIKARLRVKAELAVQR